MDSPHCSPQLFGLFDYDPYGIDILKCYRVGSKASAAEGNLSIPEMRWLGIQTGDILSLADKATLVSLNAKDRNRAARLIETTTVSGGMVAEELRDCRDELQRMLMLNKKAEIEVIGQGLSDWVNRRTVAASAAC